MKRHGFSAIFLTSEVMIWHPASLVCGYGFVLAKIFGIGLVMKQGVFLIAQQGLMADNM